MSGEFSVPLPKSLDSRIHVRLIAKAHVVVAQVTTHSASEGDSAVPMGSMVYAMPDQFNPAVPMSTVLYHEEPTIDFTTRLAKFLAKKTQKPVYVSNSLSLASTGLGGTAEEEGAAFQTVAQLAWGQLKSTVPA